MFSYGRKIIWRLPLFLMVLSKANAGLISATDGVTEAATGSQVCSKGVLNEIDHVHNSQAIMSPPKYRIKDMKFRQLGKWGLRVPIFSYGGALSIGRVVNGDAVKELMQIAWDHGCNYFDTAEGYADGKAETEIGNALKQLGWKRSEFMVATKIFFGTRDSEEPNSQGLSRKHIIEGIKASLARLQLSYVDVVHAHRPDTSVPMLETVRAFDHLVNQGWALYWGTSEWSAQQIQEAVTVAEKYNLVAPVVEQPQYSLLHRERFEVEYDPIFKNLGHGSTIWSPLKDGILTGKYNDGIPTGSRMDVNKGYFKDRYPESEIDQEVLEKVRKLTQIAEGTLHCTVAQLALAWAAHNPHVSTVILGATKPEQLKENFGALKVIDRLTPEIMEEIELIMGNKPAQPFSWRK